MRLAWATDVHLDSAKEPALEAFFHAVEAKGAHGLLLTGDIARADSVVEYLRLVRERLRKPVWFVLGNHDYYGASVALVRRRMRILSAQGGPKWLGATDVVALSPRTGLVGHDGWGDGRLGDLSRSPVDLADFYEIPDLARLSKPERATRLARLGDESAEHLARVLPQALDRFQRVVVLTHVPPFREACWYGGKPSTDDWLPYFACKAVGDVLLAEAARCPDREVTVLCGHTHGGGECRPVPNLRVVTGAARYGEPAVQPLIIQT